MGKLSGGRKDQGCLDSGLLPTEWHCLFPVPAMVHLEFFSKGRLLYKVIGGTLELHRPDQRSQGYQQAAA